MVISKSKLCKVLFLMLFLSNLSYSQVFITIDTDTQEFIESVDYSLFINKKIIYKGVTLNDKATSIDKAIDFDSISFSRVDYNDIGFAKSKIDSVIYLSKKIIYLDEVVISSEKDKAVILGETNRFVKSRARPLSKDLDYGSTFTSNLKGKLKLNQIVFYVNKVAFKTAYKINILEVEEVNLQQGIRIAQPGKVIYTSDVLYLNPKDKKTEVKLPEGILLSRDKPVFVWIQLIGYYSKEGKEFIPDEDYVTKLRFQLSNQVNYYSRWIDQNTKQLSQELINDNLRIKHDIVTLYFQDPHKSSLVTPAILLYGSKADE